MLAQAKSVLRKSWDDDARFAAFRPSLTIEDEGLILGAGTVLAPMAYAVDGTPSLGIAGREERILALLSLGFRRNVPAASLRFVRWASMQWTNGEKALAHFELAFAGLPKLPPNEGWRLFYADGLMKFGLTPRAAMVCFGLETRELDLLKYSPDQRRVPAGSGRESGRWTGAAVATPVAPPQVRLSDIPHGPTPSVRQYAQSVIVKDLATGTPVAPYGELARSYADLPENARQILQYRFFVQDDQTGEWHVGMSFPGNSQIRDTTRRRGQGAGIVDNGIAISPPGSSPLPEIGADENPKSALRFGETSAYTDQPYFRIYNKEGQPISPVTGRTAGETHYPLDPYRSRGPR